MDEAVEIQESMDEVGTLFSPPPMKKSDTRDSISSVDSDVSLSFDRRGSKGEDADLSDCSGTDETDLVLPTLAITSALKLKQTLVFTSIDNVESMSSQLQDKIEILNENGQSQGSDQTITPPSSSLCKAGEEEEEEEEEDEEPTCSDELAEKISAQVEFYFSNENIVKDAFLLKHVKRNKEGYVSLKLISSFKRVKHLSRDWRVVGAALRAKSTKLEVNDLGTKLRRKEPLPQYDQTLPSRTVIAAKLQLEKLTIESVAELFRQCGEIALIRLLRPGHPVPTEVRQALLKRPELGPDDECAVIEFTDSAAARAAQKLNLGEAMIFELQQIISSEKKRKQQSNQQQNNQQSQSVKKSVGARFSVARDSAYNSSSCPSGSEEDSRTIRMKSRGHSSKREAFTPTNPYPYHESLSPEPWLPRRFSACTISHSENNSMLIRRLSGCSNSGSTSDGGIYPNRRFSSCSSGSENNYNSALFHHTSHPNHNIYQPLNYWPGQSSPRRFSCCASPGTTPPNIVPYGFEYANNNTSSYYHQTGRRGSAECGPFLRRLSNCSRDSGYDPGSRRLSSCSSSSDSCSGFRSRSNSGFVVMAHLPENVTRLPSGPDGTRGFGRNIPANNPSTIKPVEPSCG